MSARTDWNHAAGCRVTASRVTASRATPGRALTGRVTAGRAVVGRVGGDRGSATVWAAGAVAVLMVLTVFGLHLGGALVARHQAESAADLAALAGAGGVPAGERQACDRARAVTDRMRVRLLSCSTLGWDVLVQVAARPAGPLGDLGEAAARARAGPAGRSVAPE